MKRKSIFTFCAIALMLVLSLSVLTACNKKHKFSDEWKYDEQTHWHECTTKKHTDTSDKIAHDFNAGEVIVQPTEENEGVKRFTCNTCGYQKNETVAKLAHTHTFNVGVWENDEVSHWHPATCAHKGEKSSVEEHIWNEGKVTTEPTETTEGVKTYTCFKCGRTKTTLIGKLDHVHTFDTTRWDSDAENHWRPATCSHKDEKESIEKHIWDEGVITTEPTETTEGVKTYTCFKCGRTKTTLIGKLDHVHTFDTTRWEHDSENHWRPATCSHADEKNAIAPHEWNDGEITTPANYGVEGVKTYTCAVCNATRTETIAALEAKDNTISFADDLSLDKIYDGTAVAVDVAKVNRKGDGAITITYRGEDEEYTSVAPSDAGEYTVKASVAATAEWKGGEITKSFIINKREVTLTEGVFARKLGEKLESGKFGLTCIDVKEVTNNVVEWVTICAPETYYAIGMYTIGSTALTVDNDNFELNSAYSTVRFTVWNAPDSFYAGIQDVFTVSGSGEVIITTKIANGTLKKGDQLLVNEIGKIITVNKIEKGIGMSATEVETATAGDEVSLRIEGATRAELDRGYMLSKPDTIISYSKVTVTIRAFTKDEGGQHTPIVTGITPNVAFADTFGEVIGKVTFPEGTSGLFGGEMLEGVTIDFQGKKVPAFVGRRFTLKAGGKTIAECIVTAVPSNDNGNTVNKLSTESGITADGVFEKDAALNTVHHSTDSEQGKAAIAAIDKPYDSAKIAVFDISVSKNGEKIQPNGKVKVTMPKPFDANGYVTYHIKDDNTVEELATTVDGNNIYFETTSFSYFVVAGLVNADQQHIHNYVEKVTDENLVDNATCQRKAVYRLVCSICGSLGRETFEYGELAPHNLREEKGYDPQCEKDGLTHGKRCINAGCTYTEQTAIPAIGHDMQDVAAKEPTCTEIGWKAYKRCAHYCGKTEGYEEIPATGHSMTIHVPRVEPTCEKWGNEEYKKCSNQGCDYHTEYKGLPALGHDKEWHDPYDATCTEDGYSQMFYTCKRNGCDYNSKSERYVLEALGHFLKHHEAKQADCLPGWEAYDVCQRDGCDYNTKVEIPANGKHSYVCDVCTTCNGLNPVRYTREGNYIYFGYWPQTCERDENVIAKLNEMAGTPPLPRDNNANPYNWESHEGVTYMWQKIVIYNGTKYLGVQMNDYRANGFDNLSYYIMRNGYYTFDVYWFKYEPIKWRILTTSENSAYIMSDIALDCFSMQPDRKRETYNGVFAEYNNSTGVPDGIYANNWEYSFIRSWLNETFYNEVFNDLQKEIIKTTRLDNSAISCNPNDYPKYYGYAENAGKNKYADQCNDTDDKIFLLSLRDVTTMAYGFNKEVRAEDPARNLTASDFAKFHGASMGNTQKDYVTWFTRSPSLANGNQGYTTFVLDRDDKGAIKSLDLVAEGGVVPALWITL